MRRRIIWGAGLAAMLAASGLAFGLKNGDSLTVRTTNAKVMKDPKFVGTTLKSLDRGTALTFLESKKDWYKVQAGDDTGWINKTNVVEGKKNISSMPGNDGNGANQDEIELAGRGFNPQVEDEYKKKHPELDFSHVNAIEKLEASPEDLDKFISEGKIKFLGGGE